MIRAMNFETMLAARNMKRKPARTAALVLLAAFLSLTVFAGSVVILSLRNGLNSCRKRLGADIVVVPYEARTKGEFESILLQGIPGTFYMDEAYYQKVCGIEGVETAAPQFFLASASAGCCSVPVQVIGFDPEKDFTIRPWIRESFSGEIKDGDIIVGSRINIPPDRLLKFYNTECRITAQLAETGTGLDTAVFTNMNTIRTMMKKSRELGFHYFDNADPDHTVSSVMVKVADGYDIAKVTGDINIHVRHVEASQAAGMISGIAAGLSGVSAMISVLTVLIWILSLVILAIVFSMIARERTKEFGVLRVIGASEKMIFRLLLKECAMISFLGAAAGVLLGLLVTLSFSGLIKGVLDLPYLMPGAAAMAGLAAAALLLTTAAGALSGAVSAGRVSRNDTELMLRDDV